MPFQILLYPCWDLRPAPALLLPARNRRPAGNSPGGRRCRAKSNGKPACRNGCLDGFWRWSAGLDGCLLRTEEDWQGLFDHFLEKGSLVRQRQRAAHWHALFRPGTKEAFCEAAYLTHRPIPSVAFAGCNRQALVDGAGSGLPSLPVAKVKPVFLGRITDLRAALEFPLYPPGIKGTWRLRVHDPLLQENNGVFLLEAEGDGRMHVTPAPGEEANLACGIGGLARLLSGTVSPEEAGKNPFLTGDGKLVSSFLRLFPKSGLYINDYF